MQETELCKIFMEAAESYGWTCYPETSGWDILLVRDSTQIGVQAKTRANIKVVAQCLPPMFWFGRKLSPSVRRQTVRRGPTYRAVLIPSKTAHDTKKDLCDVCQALGIWVFSEDHFGWHLLEAGSTSQSDYDWQPEELEWLPDFVPVVDAGAKSPTQLTRWKQCALRLLARAEVRGRVTSKDAKEIGVDMKVFVDRWDVQDQWLLFKEKDGRLHVYEIASRSTLGPHSKRPDVQHPEAYEHFLKEAKKDFEEDA